MNRLTSYFLLSLIGNAFAQDDNPKGADDFWKKVDNRVARQVQKRIDDNNLVRIPTLPLDDKNVRLPAGVDDRLLRRNGTLNGTSPSPSPSPSSSTSEARPQHVLSSFTFVSILCAFM